MYLFLVDLRTVGESQYKYFERLLPEIKAHRLLGEVKTVESNAAAVQIMLDNARRSRFKTVVTVGDDRFMACVAGASLGTSVALGYIPFGQECAFGEAMGLSSRVGEVGPVLAGRNLKSRELMVLGRYYAVHEVSVMPRLTWDIVRGQQTTLLRRLEQQIKFWNRLRGLSTVQTQVEWKDACLNQTASALRVALVSSLPVNKSIKKKTASDPATMLLRLFPAQLSANDLTRQWLHPLETLVTSNRVSQLKADYVRITVKGEHSVWVDGHPSAIDPPLDIRLVTSAFQLITPVERI